MKKIVYEQLQEQLYYEKMENGLDVYILPKKGLIKRTQRLQQNMDLLTINSFRSGRRR